MVVLILGLWDNVAYGVPSGGTTWTDPAAATVLYSVSKIGPGGGDYISLMSPT